MEGEEYMYRKSTQQRSQRLVYSSHHHDDDDDCVVFQKAAVGMYLKDHLQPWLIANESQHTHFNLTIIHAKECPPGSAQEERACVEALCRKGSGSVWNLQRSGYSRGIVGV
tara:strand:- start:82 stop:414 length:333 start_codon:yes stop_codon:yes gene_type:complete